MIFNSFTVANDYNFGAQWPNDRRVFLPTNKTLEGIFVLALAGKYLQKESWVLSIFETILLKKLFNLVLSLFINMSTK